VIIATRKRLIVLTFVALINGVGGALAGVTDHPVMMVSGLGVALTCGALSLALRCPQCGQAAEKRKMRLFGEEWTYWGGFTWPRRCSNCGHRF
jgi:hypothetical protein